MNRLVLATLLAVFAVSAEAGTIVWGNNASFGNVTLEAFDMDTGAVVQQFLAPNLSARADNGRGIAVSADGTIYYTVAGSGNVYKTNATTHADLGIAFSTTLGGISTIAFDGNDLFVTAYDGTNNNYVYTTSGTLVRTLSGLGNFR